MFNAHSEGGGITDSVTKSMLIDTKSCRDNRISTPGNHTPTTMMYDNDQYFISPQQQQKQKCHSHEQQQSSLAISGRSVGCENRRYLESPIVKLIRTDLLCQNENPRHTCTVMVKIADELSLTEVGGDRTVVENNRRTFVNMGGHLATSTAMKNFPNQCSVQIIGCRVIQNSVVGMSPDVRSNAIRVGCMNIIVTSMRKFPHSLLLQSSGCAALDNLIRTKDQAREFVEQNNGIELVTDVLKRYMEQYFSFLSGQKSAFEEKPNSPQGTPQEKNPRKVRRTEDVGVDGDESRANCDTIVPTTTDKLTNTSISKSKAAELNNVMQLMKRCCNLIWCFTEWIEFANPIWESQVFLTLSQIVQFSYNNKPNPELSQYYPQLKQHQSSIATIQKRASEALTVLLTRTLMNDRNVIHNISEVGSGAPMKRSYDQTNSSNRVICGFQNQQQQEQDQKRFHGDEEPISKFQNEPNVHSVPRTGMINIESNSIQQNHQKQEHQHPTPFQQHQKLV